MIAGKDEIVGAVPPGHLYIADQLTELLMMNMPIALFKRFAMLLTALAAAGISWMLAVVQLG